MRSGETGRDEAAPDPDPRFRFANDRTYLAWNRTALALIGGGLAVAQFLDVGLDGAQLIVGLALIAFGALLSRSSYHQWQRNERAMRVEQPLPPSSLPRVLAQGIAVFSLAAAALAIVHFVS